MSRPSGLPIVDDETAPVTVAVTHVESRGRLNILPRWRKRVTWLQASEANEIEALMIFVEPGLLSIRDWNQHGPSIQQRFAKLSESTDVDAIDALRLIQDRYQRLVIPARDRPSLGDGALVHLGLSVQRGQKSVVYVCVFSDRIDLMAPEYRNAKLIESHPLIDDLP
jgi:hypothetical protein